MTLKIIAAIALLYLSWLSAPARAENPPKGQAAGGKSENASKYIKYCRSTKQAEGWKTALLGMQVTRRPRIDPAIREKVEDRAVLIALRATKICLH